MNDTAEIRTLLADTARRIFETHCAQKVVEDAKKSAWSEALWRVLEEAQLPLVCVPEAAGGAGGTPGDFAAVLRIAAGAAAPVPLAETQIAGWMLAASGVAVPAGPLTVAPVRRDDDLRLTRTGGGWTLRGAARRVPYARIAHRIAVLANADGAQRVALVDPGRCAIEPGRNLAGEPRDSVRFEDLRLAGSDVVPAGGGVTPEALLERGALARAVQMAGALDRCLELSVEYAKTRVQFGRPIAKFQAIQQELARFADEVAAAGAAAMSAVGAVERGAGSVEVACAKVRAGEAAHAGTAIAHQVHAAIGATEEYRLHHFTLRLQSWRSEFGTEVEWAERLGDALLAAGAERLWPMLAANV